MSEFCNAPFSQLLLSPTGKVHPCCYHFGVKLGSKQDDFEDVWNGARIRKLRHEFLTGRIKTCSSRIRNSQCHKNFEHLDPFVTREEFLDSGPIRLDIRLNGQCNLSCIMCDVWQQPNKQWDSAFLWTDGPTTIFPNLKELELLGGEPFIQQDTFRLIDEVSKVNPDVEFSFVTNGQFLNFTKMSPYLSKVKIKKIHISFDATTAKTYETIRLKSKYDLALKNLESLKKLRTEHPRSRNFQMVASFCVLKQNLHEVEDFFSFCQKHELLPEYQFAFYDPSKSSSLLNQSPSDMKKSLEYLQGIDHPELQELLSNIKLPLLQRIAKISESRESGGAYDGDACDDGGVSSSL